MNITTITAQEAQEKFSELINQVAHNREQIKITRRGKEIAVLISLEDFALIEELKNKQDLQEAVDALKEARETGSISIDKIKEELGN